MSRRELHVTGDTFFATLRTFTLACPKCGKVYGYGKQHKLTSCYNPRTQHFRCTTCGWKARLGLIAWPSGKCVNLGRPVDVMLSPRQALRLRGAATGGLWVDNQVVRGHEPVNALSDTPEGDVEVGEPGREGLGLEPNASHLRRAHRNVEGEEGSE